MGVEAVRDQLVIFCVFFFAIMNVLGNAKIQTQKMPTYSGAVDKYGLEPHRLDSVQPVELTPARMI